MFVYKSLTKCGKVDYKAEINTNECMIYFLAIIFPPLAVLMKKPTALPFNIILCILGYLPGIIHAFMIINSSEQDKRNKKIIREMRKK